MWQDTDHSDEGGFQRAQPNHRSRRFKRRKVGSHHQRQKPRHEPASIKPTFHILKVKLSGRLFLCVRTKVQNRRQRNRRFQASMYEI